MEVSNFSEIVRSIFNCWPAIEYIRKCAAGGAETEAKLEWMFEVVSERLARRSAAPEAEVLEEFISEIVDNEFETLVEDGTIGSVSSMLCSCREMWNRGDTMGVKRLLDELEHRRKCRPVGIDQIHEDSSSSSEDMDEEHDTCHSSITVDSMDTSTPYSRNESQPDEDGWTVVRPRHSRWR